MDSDTQEPAQVQPEETTADVAAARLRYDPEMAKLAYQIAASPEYGMKPFTQLQEQTRAEVLPGESNVRTQLLQNILANLISPTGISGQQQTAINARRGMAQENLQEAMRGRANLGGNLFGGRAAGAEARSIGELQNQFAEEDIGREERARLNAIQAALPALQILFPGINISTPQFQSAAPSGDTAYQGAVSQSNLAAQLAQQQQASQNQLYGALFQGLGTAAGGYLGNENVFK